MKAAALALVLLLPACAAGPRTADELATMDAAGLVLEAASPAARNAGFVRYDPGYRDRVLARLAELQRWPAGELEKVRAGRVWIGATVDQVVAAWGRPRSHTAGQFAGAGTTLVLSYGSPAAPALVTLSDGVCTSIVDAHD